MNRKALLRLSFYDTKSSSARIFRFISELLDQTLTIKLGWKLLCFQLPFSNLNLQSAWNARSIGHMCEITDNWFGVLAVFWYQYTMKLLSFFLILFFAKTSVCTMFFIFDMVYFSLSSGISLDWNHILYFCPVDI